MSEYFLSLFLLLAKEAVMIPVIVIGYIWINRGVFSHAIYLLTLSMVMAADLKFLFNKTSEYGLVFPSGHMLVSTVLYSWIAYNFSKFRIFSLIILAAIAYGLVTKGYHDFIDIFGGIFFAFLIILSYIYLNKSFGNVIAYFNAVLIVFLFLLAKIKFPHLWLALYSFMGFFLASKYINQTDLVLSFKGKLLQSFTCFVLMVSILLGFKMLDLPIYIYQLQWLFIGAVLPLSGLINRVCKC
jgi:hypothetical protein